jgi:ribosomal protein L23
VQGVNIVKVQPKPKRRGMFEGHAARLEKGRRPLQEGDTIEIFSGAQV